MKNGIYSLLLLLGLFLSSCKGGNQYCECIDETLANLKEYRLRAYKGKQKPQSSACKELLKKSPAEIMKVKGDEECASYQELLKENRLLMEHLMDSSKELEDMGKKLNERLKDFKPMNTDRITE